MPNTAAACLLSFSLTLAALGADPAWPAWRGPEATGVAPEANPPAEWSEQKNIAWRCEVPGRGNSTPIVWGERVFLLTAIPTDKQANPEPSEFEKKMEEWQKKVHSRPGRVVRFEVLAVNAKDGSMAWRVPVRECVPHEGTHREGSWASGSPVTDGERLYAFFGSYGLYCLDLQGRKLWDADLGRLQMRNQFGEGASPALHGDKLIVVWDHEGEDFIAAFDKRTGKELWRTRRDEPSGWSTPLVTRMDGKLQVIAAGTNKSRGYDFETGKELWSCGGMTLNVIPSPVHANGLIFLASGFRGSALQAIRAEGAQGDLTGTAAVVWSLNKDTPYVPSLLVYGDLLYHLNFNKGLLSCLNARTGKAHYRNQELAGLPLVFASPVGAGNKVYVTGRNGSTAVVAHGTEFKLLATNKLDDSFTASPAVVGKTLYLRGHKRLYAIRE